MESKPKIELKSNNYSERRKKSRGSKKTYAIIALIGVISALSVLLFLIISHRNNEVVYQEGDNLDSNGRELPKLEGDIQISDYADAESNSTTSLALNSQNKIVAYIKKIGCNTEGCKPATESGAIILTQDEYDKAKRIYENDSFITEGRRSDVVLNWLLALEAITKDEEVLVRQGEIEDTVWAGIYEVYDINKDGTVSQREWGDGLLDTVITSFGLDSEK